MEAVMLALGIGAAVGFLGTAAARTIALRTGTVNAPNPIVPDHTKSVPYLGGLGIALGVLASMLVLIATGLGEAVPMGIVVGAVLFLGIGLADDLFVFNASTKLALQVGSTGLALGIGGLVPTIFGVPVVDGLIAGLWIVGVVNAVNFIDVSDGNAATLAIVTAGLFALTVGAFPLTALALVGSCVGFLAWNRPPARIFMGDAGSLFLGFLLASFALTSQVATATWPFLPMIALFLAVPIFDLLFQSTTRMSEGRPWWIGGPDSYALRLQWAGLSKSLVALATATATLAAWGAALILPILPPVGQIAVVASCAAFALVARNRLLHYKVASRAQAPASTPVTREPAHAPGQSVRMAGSADNS
jgi:UDP-GlcNAc:undecaprenyl-phosphate GlcNAc-1-phosphate transferase